VVLALIAGGAPLHDVQMRQEVALTFEWMLRAAGRGL
jgi:hypothetical protein